MNAEAHVALSVGDKVKLAHSPASWWWVIRAVTPNFAAAVHQRPFQPAGEVYYTVLDFRKQRRGPCNLIGQSYGDGSYSEADCAEMLAEFEYHDVYMAKLQAAPGPMPHEPTLEVSHRNNVPLEVYAIRRVVGLVGVEQDEET